MAQQLEESLMQHIDDFIYKDADTCFINMCMDIIEGGTNNFIRSMKDRDGNNFFNKLNGDGNLSDLLTKYEDIKKKENSEESNKKLLDIVNYIAYLFVKSFNFKIDGFNPMRAEKSATPSLNCAFGGYILGKVLGIFTKGEISVADCSFGHPSSFLDHLLFIKVGDKFYSLSGMPIYFEGGENPFGTSDRLSEISRSTINPNPNFSSKMGGISATTEGNENNPNSKINFTVHPMREGFVIYELIKFARCAEDSNVGVFIMSLLTRLLPFDFARYEDFGHFLESSGRYNDAIRAYNQALEIINAIAESNPDPDPAPIAEEVAYINEQIRELKIFLLKQRQQNK